MTLNVYRETGRKNGVGETIFATFLINIFFLVFYVNITPFVPK